VMTICSIFTLKFLNDSPVPEYKKGVQMNAFFNDRASRYSPVS